MSKIKVILEFDTDVTTHNGTYVIYKNDEKATNEFQPTRGEFIRLHSLCKWFTELVYKCMMAQKIIIKESDVT